MLAGAILGLILGALIGSIPAIFVGIAVYDYYSYEHEWLGVVVGISIEIIAIVIGILIGIKVDKVEYDKKIANWINTKNTLELSIRDETLGDTARINLVNEAIKYNMELTGLKEDVKQWWYWYLDDSKVNELEIIDIVNR